MNSENSKPEAGTPRALGYRMPAEWEDHAATWLTWPRRDGISFPDRYDSIPDYWVTMCRLLSPHEEVHINVFNEVVEEEIRVNMERGKVKIGERVILHRFPSYEPWCRDHGPIFLVKTPRAETSAAPLVVVDWAYNAWGGKYPPCDLDDAVPQHVAKLLGVPIFTPGIVMEGGALEVNGKGTLLTTESCLLHPNRNPNLSRGQIEQYLRDYLGVSHVLWLGDGVEGDDTDGHIDDLTRFVNSTTIVTVVEEDPKDVNYERLQENLRRLRTMKDQDGRPFRIVALPMPGVVEYDGQRLPASYANFYIANRTVLLPVYGHRNDAVAVRTLQELFPDRRVEAVNCVDLIWGLGAFHCVTQQQPQVSIA